MRKPNLRATSRKAIEILLVEDNPGDIRLLTEAFNECCFDARLNIVRDGIEALSFLRRQPPFENAPRPELILLDLNLPRKDGREALAEIKKEPAFRRIPVMILSTSTRPEDVDRAYDLHANCYLAKPTDIGGLIAMTKNIEEFWLKTATLSGGSNSQPPLSAARRTA